MRRLVVRLLFAGVLSVSLRAPAATSALHREILSPATHSAAIPPNKRVPAGWPAFAVDSTPVVLRASAPSTAVQSGGAWLRFTTALDDREPRVIEVSAAANGRVLGQLDLRFAHALEIFQLALTQEQAAEVRAGGVTLRRKGTGSPVWFFAAGPSGSTLPREYQPHLLTAGAAVVPPVEFHRRLASLASLQTFGWMEGCVLEGLNDLARRVPAGPYRSAGDAHWRIFLPAGDRLVFENPRSEPSDHRLHSIEDGLPFADLARRQPDAAGVDLFIDYCMKLRRADGAIQGGDMLSAEGSYTIAYPLAVIATARHRPDLATLAVEQLTVRRQRLWHDGALWLRHYDDDRRTFRGWARGVAWHVLGTARALGALQGRADLAPIEADLRRAADWLLPLQRSDGLWSCFVEDRGTPPDTSGSAGIATALAHGARLGVLPPAAAAAAHRTLAALQLQLTPDGFLGGAAQSNRGGEALQRSDYRVLSQMGMGLLAQLIAECGEIPSPGP